MKSAIISILVVLLFELASIAQSYDQTCTLFKLERSRDASFILYELNVNYDGRVAVNDPIKVYWVKQEHVKEPLTWIQNKYAYGIEIKNQTSSSSDSICFKFAAFEDREFTVKQNTNNAYKAFTIINDREVEVSKIYVEFQQGTTWTPDISNVALYGIDNSTGQLLIDNIYKE